MSSQEKLLGITEISSQKKLMAFANLIVNKCSHK